MRNEEGREGALFSRAAVIEGYLPFKFYCRLFFDTFPFPLTTAKLKGDRFLEQYEKYRLKKS
jgi:hypothetical protein